VAITLNPHFNMTYDSHKRLLQMSVRGNSCKTTTVEPISDYPVHRVT